MRPRRASTGLRTTSTPSTAPRGWAVPHVNASAAAPIPTAIPRKNRKRNARKLISGGTNTYPSWAPDGKKILFRRMVGEKDSEVFVADPDGSHAVNLTRNPAFDGWPAWSPDGKRIAFASNRADMAVWQIYVMDADGSHMTRVAETDGRATVPRWSADGAQIYFTICKKVDGGADCHIHRAAPPH